MISIIISSSNRIFLENITKNITETVGLTFEIISFDNADGKKGLSELYNGGANKAKYDLVCFMHEDVNIKTKNWGVVIANIFEQNEKVGLIGLAGSSYKTLVPSGWFCDAGSKITNHVNMLQRYKFSETETKLVYQNPKGGSISKVTAVDGVWFCTKKSIVSEYPFDGTLFQKFHCYDLDFSFSVSQSYDVMVTYEILLEHFSEGNYDKTWIEETLKLHEKWSNYLPLDYEGLSKKEKFIAEKYSFRVFIKQMLTVGYSKFEIFKIFWNSSFRKHNLKLFFKLVKEIRRTQIS
ncbi:glycosyltransferase [Pedobacter aquatilis]|uniref:glycosyltransferase n=1 Tax=Pedobacter aquatilis TaxID=351343 RepID=UPI0025B5A0E8|nr:glycosyltransferase [Pedobacter aquatilis]MDN3587416.1 glycosyltransferase [Pedobacter aquatilis]